jgi:hypothetical protein
VRNFMSRPLRRISHRAAPSGIRPPRMSAGTPPDGWDLVTRNPGSRLVDGMDSALLRMTDAAAGAVTRRGLLRRSAQVGLLGAAATGGMLSLSREAGGDIWQGGCGPHSGGCGPSPFCTSSACYANHNCNNQINNIRNRGVNSTNRWEGYDCIGNDSENCWQECCSGNVIRCCDCCVPPAYSQGSLGCNICPNPYLKACICRGGTGGHC